MDLWRRLLRRDWTTSKRAHSIHVLSQARAPSPLLALAAARASFLRRLLEHGPAECLHLMQAQWEEFPERSWLGQLTGDVKLVAQYVPAAKLLLQTACPMRALLHAHYDNPRWWTLTVKAACKVCIADFQAWCQAVPATVDPAPCDIDEAERGLPGQSPALIGLPVSAFACHLCRASFPKRKLLYAHLSKTHQVLSPARHFAPVPWCLSCLTYFHTVQRVQQHLKQSSRCMLRLPHLLAPMSSADIADAEAPTRSHHSRVASGGWQHYQATAPAAKMAGPLAPTLAERFLDEDDILATLRPLFRPREDDVAWIAEYVSGRGREGPQQSASTFWERRIVSPACSSFGTRSNTDP